MSRAERASRVSSSVGGSGAGEAEGFLFRLEERVAGDMIGVVCFVPIPLVDQVQDPSTSV